jgi:hypothetical protein
MQLEVLIQNRERVLIINDHVEVRPRSLVRHIRLLKLSTRCLSILDWKRYSIFHRRRLLSKEFVQIDAPICALEGLIRIWPGLESFRHVCVIKHGVVLLVQPVVLECRFHFLGCVLSALIFL